jgi:hypothetical protein
MPNSGFERLKSESLNLLETSGPVKACNGITLPLQVGLNDMCINTGANKGSEGS